jgi:aryl-alcohol dehydrogenase-like predicted oxidoreductase
VSLKHREPTRDPEAELLPLLRKLGIGFVPYSPLGIAIGPAWFAACADQSKDFGNRGDKAGARGGDEIKTRILANRKARCMVAVRRSCG